MSIDAILLDFDRFAPTLRERGQVLEGELAACLAVDGLKLHSVTLRIKDRNSLAQKLARPDRTYHQLWDVTDVVGIRVITYFDDSVDRVAALLEGRLAVDYALSVDKRRQRDGEFGYRSLHYIAALGGELPKEARAEIQIRTVLQHAWAEIEHDLGYKAQDTVPAAVRRRLSRLAGLLELADHEFVAIRDEIRTYSSALPDRIARADGEDVPLDRLSLVTLLTHADVRALDEQVAALLGRELGDEPFYPEYLLKMLAASGVHTVSDARRGLEVHGPRILAMVKPYFAFAWTAWRLSPDGMDRIFRGYALFFLAHAAVIHGPALGISKVERLAHLYRELDYPDDARAAQRVASQLLEALREAGAG